MDYFYLKCLNNKFHLNYETLSSITIDEDSFKKIVCVTSDNLCEVTTLVDNRKKLYTLSFQTRYLEINNSVDVIFPSYPLTLEYSMIYKKDLYIEYAKIKCRAPDSLKLIENTDNKMFTFQQKYEQSLAFCSVKLSSDTNINYLKGINFLKKIDDFSVVVFLYSLNTIYCTEDFFLQINTSDGLKFVFKKMRNEFYCYKKIKIFNGNNNHDIDSYSCVKATDLVKYCDVNSFENRTGFIAEHSFSFVYNGISINFFCGSKKILLECNNRFNTSESCECNLEFDKTQINLQHMKTFTFECSLEVKLNDNYFFEEVELLCKNGYLYLYDIKITKIECTYQSIRTFNIFDIYNYQRLPLYKQFKNLKSFPRKFEFFIQCPLPNINSRTKVNALFQNGELFYEQDKIDDQNIFNFCKKCKINYLDVKQNFELDGKNTIYCYKVFSFENLPYLYSKVNVDCSTKDLRILTVIQDSSPFNQTLVKVANLAIRICYGWDPSFCDMLLNKLLSFPYENIHGLKSGQSTFVFCNSDHSIFVLLKCVEGKKLYIDNETSLELSEEQLKIICSGGCFLRKKRFQGMTINNLDLDSEKLYEQGEKVLLKCKKPEEILHYADIGLSRVEQEVQCNRGKFINQKILSENLSCKEKCELDFLIDHLILENKISIEKEQIVPNLNHKVNLNVVKGESIIIKTKKNTFIATCLFHKNWKIILKKTILKKKQYPQKKQKIIKKPVKVDKEQKEIDDSTVLIKDTKSTVQLKNNNFLIYFLSVILIICICFLSCAKNDSYQQIELLPIRLSAVTRLHYTPSYKLIDR